MAIFENPELGIVTGTPGQGGRLSNLFKNKMFLQMLAASGQGIAAGEGVGPRLGGVVQQNIAAQSYAKQQDRYLKILQSMLAGEQIPEGGKLTMDSKGMSISVPKLAMEAGGEISTGGAGGGGVGPGAGLSSEVMKIINPSLGLLGDISAADLAGLTPQDLQSALSSAMGIEALKRDIPYKQALTEEARARTEAGRAIFTIPGTDVKLTSKQWLDWYKTSTKDERTAAIKNYEYAQAQGFEGSFEQFQDAASTSKQKDYEAAVRGGYKGSFNEWMLQMAKAGATTIVDFIGRKKAISALEGQFYFDDPKWTTDLSRHMSSEDVQNAIFQSETPDQIRAEESVKFIENKIIGGGGTIEDVKFSDDGKTMIWTVRWPSGDVETIKHGIRP